MPFDEEKQIQQLISMYRQGFEEILRVIVEKEAKGQWTQYWRDLLLEVRAILQQLDQYTDQWIEQTIGQVYSQAAAETVAFLSGLGVATAANPEFAQIHQRAIDVVAQNMADNLRGATQFIGRRVNDVFRQVGLEQTGRKLAAGQTWQDMKQKVVQQLLDKGQTAFVDRLDRKWKLDTYAEMVARTTTREAASIATLNTCQEFNLDLVRITTHYPTCEKCAPLQGKVFSISGKDKRYPKLKDEYRPPIHPNCRHVLVPYVRELDNDAEETERLSNTSFNKDPRTEQEKRAYDATQKQFKPDIRAVTKADAEIELLLHEAPLGDRTNLIRTLLDNSGMQKTSLFIKVGLRENGFTRFGLKDGKIEVAEVVLKSDDQRPWYYQIKTVFHELTHARVNGAVTKAQEITEITRRPGWLKAEETIAETVAHYMAEKAGITQEIVPSYSRILVEMLPKLKKRPEFADCKTVSDFGRILSERRFGGIDVEHKDLDAIALEDFDVRKYAEQYREYVMQNVDEITQVIVKFTGDPAVNDAVVKSSIMAGWRGTDTPGFYDSLIVAMNRLGVKKP